MDPAHRLEDEATPNSPGTGPRAEEDRPSPLMSRDSDYFGDPDARDYTDSPASVREAVANGNAWLTGMTRTLERLDGLCTTQ